MGITNACFNISNPNTFFSYTSTKTRETLRFHMSACIRKYLTWNKGRYSNNIKVGKTQEETNYKNKTKNKHKWSG